MSDQALAIIPARGGSKRIPRKNIKPFLGKPIIQYAVEAALESECFDEVMISTEDNEIASLGRELGAAVPFFRSKENSSDHAGTVEVLCEVISDYREKLHKTYEYVCCIYPTAPFLSSSRLQEAKDLLVKSDADCVLPVVRHSYPIQRSLRIIDNKAVMLWPENYYVRSQDLEATYHDSGQFYFLKTDSLLKQMRLFAEHTVPLILPETEVQDIDTEEDWKLAELKYKGLISL